MAHEFLLSASVRFDLADQFFVPANLDIEVDQKELNDVQIENFYPHSQSRNISTPDSLHLHQQNRQQHGRAQSDSSLHEMLLHADLP